MEIVRNIAIKIPEGSESPVFQTAFNILRQEIEKRDTSGAVAGCCRDMLLTLDICEGIGREGYTIANTGLQEIRITGNDELGLLYGVGRFLRCLQLEKGRFIPSSWSGTSIPEKEIRGIYFATHFHNFYHDAPIKEVKKYIDELVLWGINTLCVWFDMHHYKSIQQPEAQAMISRIQEILSHARNMYMKTCLLFIGNEAFDESPVELRALYSGGHDGYSRQLAGHYHVELCPSKDEGLDLLLQWRKEVFEQFLDVKLDYIWIWPYDQGGCTCSDCKPWGANGYLKVAEPVARLAREMFPAAKIVLSTWLFDSFTSGEWDGLSEVFAVKPDWVDYILAEFLEGSVPEVIVKKGFPGQLPCLGFPEISMYGATPWGGFGANPIPEHIAEVWNKAGKCLSGGFPYSEGIFDDINKFIYARLYWGDITDMHGILQEYTRYEFGPQYTKELVGLIKLLEKTIVRNRLDEEGKNHNYPDSKIPWKGEQRFVIQNTEGIYEAYNLSVYLNERLPDWAKESWRWKVLRLRSLIDFELLGNDFKTNETIENAYEELTRIYYAYNADYYVAPPSLKSIQENRGGFSWF